MKKLLLSLVCLLCMAGSAAATPSILINAPSADVQPFQTFRVGIDNNTTMFTPPSSRPAGTPATRVYPATTFGFTSGVFDAVVLQAEAGVDVKEVSEYPVSFHGKVVSPEGTITEFMPSLFIGFYDAGTKVNQTDFNIIYGGLAKTIGTIGRFTIGYFTGNSRLLKDGSGKTDNNGIILGYDRRLPGISENLWFGIDYMGSQSQYGALSVGFSWMFAENAALTIGYKRYNDLNSAPLKRDVVSWQVDFDF